MIFIIRKKRSTEDVMSFSNHRAGLCDPHCFHAVEELIFQTLHHSSLSVDENIEHSENVATRME